MNKDAEDLALVPLTAAAQRADPRPDPGPEIGCRLHRSCGCVASGLLFQGARELVIEHNGDSYRLRITRNEKLILTK